MGKTQQAAGGGLTAADRAKLIPENLRKGVVLFGGTAKEITGSLAPYRDYFIALWNYNFSQGTQAMGTVSPMWSWHDLWIAIPENPYISTYYTAANSYGGDIIFKRKMLISQLSLLSSTSNPASIGTASGGSLTLTENSVVNPGDKIHFGFWKSYCLFVATAMD